MAAKRENVSAGLSPLPKKGKGDEGAIDVEEDPEEDMQIVDEPPWAKNLKKDLLSGLRHVVQEEMQPVKEDLADLRFKVVEVETTAKQAIEIAMEAKSMAGAPPNNDDLLKRITEVEGRMTHGWAKLQTHIAVFGGFADVSKETATSWINTTLRNLHIEPPGELYFKGETFKGILFAKFPSPAVAQAVEDAFNKNKYKISDKDVWCKKDRPIEVRSCMGLLLGLRRQLLEWGFEKNAVRVDEDTMVMKIGGVPVLSASVLESKLVLKWLDESWKHWDELQKSLELQDLIQKANTKLESKGKGEGKGKMGPGRAGGGQHA